MCCGGACKKRAAGYDAKGEVVAKGRCLKLRCAVWYCLFPLILLWHSLRIYLLGCLGSYAAGLCGRCWICVGRLLCCCCSAVRCCHSLTCCICFHYIDKDFDHEDHSLCNDSTKPEGKEAFAKKSSSKVEGGAVVRGVEWKRIEQLFEEDAERPCLFAGKIEPSDVHQGGIGDCWLMASFAALTMCDGAIQQCFLTSEYTARGMYEVRLYDGRHNKFVTVVVDDFVPVHRGTSSPLFAKPSGSELWVLLLEKAFAKLVGSYYELTGGSTAWGLQALTGDRIHLWSKKADGWHESELKHRNHADGEKLARLRKGQQAFEKVLELVPDDKDAQQSLAKVQAQVSALEEQADGGKAKIDDVVFYQTEAHAKGHASGELFDSLQVWRSRGALVTASASGEDGARMRGLRTGHAYSVHAAIEHEGVQMVRLQNPWGERPKQTNSKPSLEAVGLWSGRMCVGSDEWSQPEFSKLRKMAEHAIGEGAAAELDSGESQGFCWLPYAEFERLFTQMTVCHRSHSIDDIRLDVHEDSGCCGPTVGCICGCAWYYCCCAGVESLCCETDHTTDHKKPAESQAAQAGGRQQHP